MYIKAAVWLLLSAVAFAGTVASTLHISFVTRAIDTVESGRGGDLYVGILADPRNPGEDRVAIDYLPPDQNIQLTVRLRPGDRRVLVTSLMASACTFEGGSTSRTVPFAPLGDGRTMMASLDDLQDQLRASFPAPQLNCPVSLTIEQETYTTVLLLVGNIAGDPIRSAWGREDLLGMYGRPLKIDMVSTGGSSEIVLTSDEHFEETRALRPPFFVIERLRLQYFEQRRDIWILAIGVLGAFAVAMFIESLRPFVDRIPGSGPKPIL
jgi:hypothetical protein